MDAKIVAGYTANNPDDAVSIAKALGYTPRSYLGASATVTITVTPPTSFTGTNLTLSRNAVFTSAVNGSTYKFYPLEDVTTSAIVDGGVKKFVFTDLVLKEGLRTANQFTVQAANPQGPYIIPNESIDATTIRARVQTSLSDTSLTTWNKSTAARPSPRSVNCVTFLSAIFISY